MGPVTIAAHQPSSELMILLTLPFWFIAAAVAIVVVGWVIGPRRWRPRLTLATILVVMVVVFQATTLPHGLWAVAWYTNPGARPLLEDLDLSLSRMQRDEVVRRAQAGELAPSTRRYAGPEDFLLPDGFTGLSDGRTIWVLEAECGVRVFFRTITGFSPDPYGGFEYATPGCDPELDPLGSGQGRARALGYSWYWIDAR